MYSSTFEFNNDGKNQTAYIIQTIVLYTNHDEKISSFKIGSCIAFKGQFCINCLCTIHPTLTFDQTALFKSFNHFDFTHHICVWSKLITIYLLISLNPNNKLKLNPDFHAPPLTLNSLTGLNRINRKIKLHPNQPNLLAQYSKPTQTTSDCCPLPFNGNGTECRLPAVQMWNIARSNELNHTQQIAPWVWRRVRLLTLPQA